jgi:hypothetical protein
VDQFFSLVPGEDQNFRLRRQLPNLPGGLEAVQLRHRHVEHGDIRLQAVDFFHRITPGGDLCTNFPTIHGLDDTFEAAPHYLVIVSD